MIVEDVLYGSYEVEEVLATLILSEEIQRLKDVHMAGPAFLINSAWNETRYEHSIGVMMLIRRLGGTVEEQIAGLLHDVSHTVFSHVIDLALSNEADDYHEQIKARLIEQSAIPTLLRQYGFDYEKILLDDEKWPLLEQKAPLLCCDRIDYTLREVYRYFSVPIQEIQQFLNSIKIIKEKIVLSSIDEAIWFIDQYRKVVIDFFYDPRNICSYEWMANAIRLGFENNEVTLDDLLTTDSIFLERLKSSDSNEIIQLLKKMDHPPKYTVCSSDDNYDIQQKKKIRFVDPLVEETDKIVSVSTVSQLAQIKIEKLLDDSKRGIFLKFY
ncbi:hypothetical protein IGL98_000981 [Enterococcus sp. DIV0840]|uniref:HD domain-containing protein n=1 Tax=Enterococcus TaxID=1350 RepID=UPI001A8ECFE8|nr:MULTISPECIES: HD domain-containing protein [Enterococcus]MBO0433622.1 HD domain-containing protein [Enterococcus sp. DIV0849a]MBO0474711.1 HD domain-containing protein [Enterococcus ureasiticus]